MISWPDRRRRIDFAPAGAYIPFQRFLSYLPPPEDLVMVTRTSAHFIAALLFFPVPSASAEKKDFKVQY
jgi:hypothetical protein